MALPSPIYPFKESYTTSAFVRLNHGSLAVFLLFWQMTVQHY